MKEQMNPDLLNEKDALFEEWLKAPNSGVRDQIESEYFKKLPRVDKLGLQFLSALFVVAFFAALWQLTQLFNIFVLTPLMKG